MKSTIHCALAVGFLAAHASSTTWADAPKQFVLENGATVLLMPVEGVQQVAVEAFYNVGFLHEPAGMTQASHLLEHLVCLGATESYRERESFQRINDIGMANAETLADWTHFDYTVPAEKLTLALQIEAERLSSLRFDEQLIRGEAKRCYRETDFAEKHASSGMLKHAMMAYSQAWRHAATSALVRGGLEEISVDQLTEFHRSHYRPDRLVLVLVGDFETSSALELVKTYIGAVEAPPAAQSVAIDWTKAPGRHTIRWDARVRGVCIAYPPAESSTDAAILSLFGIHLLQQLSSSPQLNEVADATFCSTHAWKVGTLPFFAYAAAKEGRALNEVENALKSCLRESMQRAPEALQTVKTLARQLEMQTSSMDRDSIDVQVRQWMRLQNVDRPRASAMVLGQAAIQLGLFNRLAGPKPRETLERFQSLTKEEFEEILRTHLDGQRMLVTHVVPLQTLSAQNQND